MMLAMLHTIITDIGIKELSQHP